MQTAISIRQQVSDWYSENKKSTEDDQSTDTHRYFNSCLVQIQDYLRPYFGTQPAIPTHFSGNTQHGNRFGKLEVEETEELESTSSPSPKVAESSDTSKGTTTISYELDNSEDQDIIVKLWSMFEDFHQYSELTKNLWQSYADNTISLETASFVTELIIERVEKLEENFIATTPKLFNGSEKHSYRSIRDFIYKNFSVENNPKLKKYMLFYEALFLIKKFGISRHWTPCSDFMSLQVRSRLYEAGQDQSEEFITKMILDLRYYQNAVGNVGEDTPYLQTDPTDKLSPYVDSITAHLYRMTTQGTSVKSVYSAHVLLVINQVLGEDVKACYLKLRQAAAEAKHTLSKSIDCDKLIRESKSCFDKTEIMPLWFAQNADQEATTTVNYIRAAIERNILASTKKSVLDCPAHAWDAQCKCCIGTAEERMPGRIWPSKELTFYTEHNPVYSGMESLRLMLVMEKAGIALLNDEPLISMTSHLYNMVKQGRNGIKLRWPALERLMEDYKSELFCGSYPTKPDEILRRFLICGGVKISVFSPTVRASEQRRLQDVKFPSIFKQSNLSVCLEQFLDGNCTAEALLHAASRARSTKMPEHAASSSSNTEILMDFARNLEATLPRIRHNYIKIREECYILYQGLRKSLIPSGPPNDIRLAEYLIQRASGGNPFAAGSNANRMPVSEDDKELMARLINVFDLFLESQISDQDTVNIAPLSTESVSSFPDPWLTALAGRKWPED